MKGLHRGSLAFLATFVFSSVSMAETHEVMVNDDFFSPNDLTINVGDTVRWVNPAGGVPHNVTADDNSFASVTNVQFTYERTFNSVGEILYYCSIHSAPGANRNTAMNGRIVVQQGPPVAIFEINQGLNDAWYNPLTLGQGFFITVFPDIQKMFLAWFTYDLERPPEDVTAILGEPGHRWLTAFGDYSGNTATLDVEISKGGVFDSATPPVTQEPDGTITVEFTDCNAGEVTYNIPSAEASGVVPIERISLDNVELCESLAPAP